MTTSRPVALAANQGAAVKDGLPAPLLLLLHGSGPSLNTPLRIARLITVGSPAAHMLAKGSAPTTSPQHRHQYQEVQPASYCVVDISTQVHCTTAYVIEHYLHHFRTRHQTTQKCYVIGHTYVWKLTSLHATNITQQATRSPADGWPSGVRQCIHDISQSCCIQSQQTLYNGCQRFRRLPLAADAVKGSSESPHGAARLVAVPGDEAGFAGHGHAQTHLNTHSTSHFAVLHACQRMRHHPWELQCHPNEL